MGKAINGLSDAEIVIRARDDFGMTQAELGKVLGFSADAGRSVRKILAPEGSKNWRPLVPARRYLLELLLAGHVPPSMDRLDPAISSKIRAAFAKRKEAA